MTVLLAVLALLGLSAAPQPDPPAPGGGGQLPSSFGQPVRCPDVPLADEAATYVAAAGLSCTQAAGVVRAVEDGAATVPFGLHCEVIGPGGRAVLGSTRHECTGHELVVAWSRFQ